MNSKIETEQIPTCKILGVNIAAINMNWLVEYLQKNIKTLSGNYITVANVHTTVMAFENNKYCGVQNGSIMAIPDGGPLSIVGKKRGYEQMSRTTGPSLMGEIFKISSLQGYRHFFYGSTEETLKKMCKNIETAYPDIQIAGTYSPPFRTMTVQEDAAIIAHINALKPDFIWVGLGAPKQEIWMAEHKNKVSGLMIGVGAGFDYYAGNIKRAPLWMQERSLEWLYRLMQDPKRLFMRYLKTNLKFIYLIKKDHS